MGEVFINRISRGGGTPTEFSNPLQILTESTTWTCPKTGTYFISCIGSGGCGAAGDCDFPASMSRGFYIASGGAGGIAESTIDIKRGESYVITVDSGITSFGNKLSATAGSDGVVVKMVTDDDTTKPANQGKGGAGSGGDQNYSGGDGETSPAGEKNKIYGGSTNKSAKYGGAKGGDMYAYAYYSVGDAQFIHATEPYQPIYNSLVPFGAGGGHPKSEIVPYDDYPDVDMIHSPNGAVIIELLK